MLTGLMDWSCGHLLATVGADTDTVRILLVFACIVIPTSDIKFHVIFEREILHSIYKPSDPV